MKEIPLTKGYVAIVDDEYFEFLSQWKWCYSNGYAVRSVHIGYFNGKRKQSRIWMHRLINKTPKGFDTDHINNNRLDNRKTNLRTTTRSQNIRNACSKSGSKSKYKGVYWEGRTNKWFAQIRPNGKGVALGTFKNEEDAALAYNFAALEHFGEYSKLNGAA